MLRPYGRVLILARGARIAVHPHSYLSPQRRKDRKLLQSKSRFWDRGNKGRSMLRPYTNSRQSIL
jgi:hypothetical protein